MRYFKSLFVKGPKFYGLSNFEDDSIAWEIEFGPPGVTYWPKKHTFLGPPTMTACSSAALLPTKT